MATLAEIEAELGFTRAEDVQPDTDRPGLLRARTHQGEERWDVRTCVLHDGRHPEAAPPRLEPHGFEAVELSSHRAVQDALAHIRRDDRISDESDAALRAAFHGAVLRLGDGRGLRVDFVADDGLINRRSGPNRLAVNDGADGRNGHDAAPGIHADQDVFGVPLVKLMDGQAPAVFRHQTPDGRNDEAAMFLLNVWIPVQQITNPLVFMDRRTLDQQRHQLRYGLPVTGFLDRDDDQQVNDIWTFLPDARQEWHFRSEMGPELCYVFDTLGTPHGAGVLPGEDALEVLYLALADACAAAVDGDEDRLADVAGAPIPSLAEVTTEPIREAHAQMAATLQTARADAGWLERARAAMDSVIRKSVELRIVATLVD